MENQIPAPAMKTDCETTFEDSLKRLEEITRLLESASLSLEESMRLYREGLAHSQICREKLDNARHELEMWDGSEAALTARGAAPFRGGEK